MAQFESCWHRESSYEDSSPRPLHVDQDQLMSPVQSTDSKGKSVRLSNWIPTVTNSNSSITDRICIWSEWNVTLVNFIYVTVTGRLLQMLNEIGIIRTFSQDMQSSGGFKLTLYDPWIAGGETDGTNLYPGSQSLPSLSLSLSRSLFSQLHSFSFHSLLSSNRVLTW